MIKKDYKSFSVVHQTIVSIFVTKTEQYDDVWREHEREEILKAIAVSLLCGLINALGMTALYIVFDDAGNNGLNISVCSAIFSSNCVFGLIASFTVFKDKISIFQTLGVFVNLGGVLIISLGNGGNSATLTMMIGSITASACIGLRIILSRY